jgi:hypothetical protein
LLRDACLGERVAHHFAGVLEFHALRQRDGKGFRPSTCVYCNEG